MAIVDSTIWAAFTGTTLTGADATALSSWCTAVDAAIKRLLLPYLPESATVTDEILDAPPSRDLLLRRRPVRSVTSIYYRADAYGVAANFTSDYLLVAGTDYGLLVDDPTNGWGASGIVRRIGTVWGVGGYTAPGTLAPRMEPIRGAIKATYAAGPSSVPGDIQAAAVTAVSLLMQRRKTGAALASESFGGYSYSNAGPVTAEGAVNSPEVVALLRPYRSVHFG